MVDGVDHQIRLYFERDIGQKPEWARWDATDTLFRKHCRSFCGYRLWIILAIAVTWVGINDCA